jgi:hypothetical protein
MAGLARGVNCKQLHNNRNFRNLSVDKCSKLQQVATSYAVGLYVKPTWMFEILGWNDVV